VIFVDDVSRIPLESWGPKIEHHLDIFPERVNVEFVQVINKDRVKMRVWERGAGITLSCGSGTAAVQAASHLTGNAGDLIRVDVPGGALMTEYREDSHVFLSGPAARVFTGEWL
jgi:diaminopimelate epimerase